MAIKKVRRWRWNLAFCRPSRPKSRSAISARVSSLPQIHSTSKTRQAHLGLDAAQAARAMP